MPPPRRAFLDIDIGGHRAAHARAAAFVAATSLRYGLSSAALDELGGGERARLAELYASDHEWAPRGPIALAPAPAERLVVELFEEAAPNCCENFAALCSGSKGKAKGSGLPLSYKGVRLHRLVPGAFVQGGDFVKGNGAGGESIWGGTFKDEKGALALKLDRRGLVAMSNTGKNSNGAQFFFTLGALPKLSGKHCVFGQVVAGAEVLDAIEAVAVDDERPRAEILIVDCGLLP
jgi:cyclophilin family peptidyl-prolyl cis-trans isomerase